MGLCAQSAFHTGGIRSDNTGRCANRCACPARPQATAQITDECLIAAAPDGYAAACAAYSFFLSLPMGETRIKAQGLMCELRNYIASVTDKSAEDTQNEYELRAITKATEGE